MVALGGQPLRRTLWLAEVLEAGQILGMTVTLVGVFVVIRDQRLASDRGKFREGKVADGILLGVLAALCQASGIALSKVVMMSSLGALEVSAVRNLGFCSEILVF